MLHTIRYTQINKTPLNIILLKIPFKYNFFYFPITQSVDILSSLKSPNNKEANQLKLDGVGPVDNGHSTD